MPKLLVAYATRAGSTAEVAGFMGKVLSEAGARADVLPIKQACDLRGYSGVILGSAIRMGSVLPELIKFVRTHVATLSQMPLAYFNVIMTLMEDTPENGAIVDSYFRPLRAICEPLRVGAFAGKMNCTRRGAVLRFSLPKNREEIAESDWIDWEAIRTWTLEVLPLIGGERAAS
jgi:menaquinone-dependent protoporphyrinogen oxidase